jgi:hypothetical protein
MRRLGTATLAAVVIAMLASTAGAAYAGPQLSASTCGGGKLVINVTHKVVGDLEDGFNGGWAFDAYNRQVQVWQTGPNTFCATVNYEGQFVTVPGQTSPADGSTNVLGAAVKGTFNGGYRTNQFTGTLNPAPALSTRGNIGSFDYACDLDFNCSYFSWVDTYFTSVSGNTLDWWGWEYKYRNQRWVNAIDGSSGDITG